MMYEISFKCYYDTGTHTSHRQLLRLEDIPRWIDAYQFTHPSVKAISVKVWFESVVSKKEKVWEKWGEEENK